MINKVIEWAKERNLHTADPDKQLLKLREEYGELNQAIAKNRQADLEDAIGDMIVVLIILCLQSGAEQISFSDEYVMYYDGGQNGRYLHGIDLGILQLSEYFLHRESNLIKKPITDNAQRIVDALRSISTNYGVYAQDCLEVAYNEIKNRKGKMVNGVFVKESDL